MLLKIAEAQTDPSKHHKLLHTNTPPEHVILLSHLRQAKQLHLLNYPLVLDDTFAYTEQADHLLTVTALKNVYHLHTREEKYLY